MALIEKSIDSILEQESSIKLPVGDIGNEFVEMYKNIDLSTREKVDKLDNVKFKQDVLRNASDPKLKEQYDKLSKKQRSQLDALPIRDKYSMLRQLLKADEEKAAKNLERRKKNPKFRLLIRLIFLRLHVCLIRPTIALLHFQIQIRQTNLCLKNY
jgi:hypothetical protein